MQCIGATTLEEYRKHIEKDTASNVALLKSWLTSHLYRMLSTFLAVSGENMKVTTVLKFSTRPSSLLQLSLIDILFSVKRRFQAVLYAVAEAGAAAVRTRGELAGAV